MECSSCENLVPKVEAIAEKVFARGAGHGSDPAADAARRTARPQADFLPWTMVLPFIIANTHKGTDVRTPKQKVQGWASGLEAGGQRSEPLILPADPTGRLSKDGPLRSYRGAA